MKRLPVLLLLFLSVSAFAQKSYLVHLTIDKVVLGKDSVVFKTGKTFLLEITGKSDTIEVAKPGGTPVGMVVQVRRIKAGEQFKYQLGYSFFKKANNKWELIRNFGFVDRYELLSPKPGFETSAKKRPAREEYHCQLGEPQQFEAAFRMDVYKK